MFPLGFPLYLAPPWNLTLALATLATQLVLLTTGRPVASLFTTILVLIVSPLTFTSKEPLSFLFGRNPQRGQRWRKGLHFMSETVFTHITLRYLTLQFPCRFMKASPMVSLTPVPGTRATADLGNPTFTSCMLEQTVSGQLVSVFHKMRSGW